MEKKYKKIDFYFGSIDEAVKELSKYKENGELVVIEFNQQLLYSDIDDTDSAYKKIVGMSKSEYDEMAKKRNDEYEAELKRHEEAIPQLTVEWIEKGNNILDEKYHELWAKCVPIRLGDLYRGMELECCLNIVKELNDGCSLDAAKEIITNQGHSGMSFSLVRSMVKSFCNRGSEFAAYVS